MESPRDVLKNTVSKTVTITTAAMATNNLTASFDIKGKIFKNSVKTVSLLSSVTLDAPPITNRLIEYNPLIVRIPARTG